MVEKWPWSSLKLKEMFSGKRIRFASNGIDGIEAENYYRFYFDLKYMLAKRQMVLSDTLQWQTIYIYLQFQ